MSHIYTSLVTVGDVDIYQVSVDPNGVLPARKGSLALRNDVAATYQNTDGSTTWALVGTEGQEPRIYASTLLVPEGQAYPFGSTYTGTNPDPQFGQLCFNSWGVGVNDLIENFNIQYNRCKVDIRVLSNTGSVTRYTGMSFANTAALVTWIDANVPNAAGLFTSTARMIIYDEVDTSIQPLTRLTGVNGVQQRLAKKDPEDWNAHIGGNQGRQFFCDLWQMAHGVAFPYAAGDPAWTGPTPTPYSVFWWMGKRALQWKVCWDGPTGKVAGKRIFGGVVANQIPNPGWTYTTPVWGAIHPDGMSYEVGDPLLGQAQTALAAAQRDGKATILALPATDTAGGLGLCLVPSGLDTFYTNWFDATAYRLEALGADEQFGTGRLRVMTPTLAGWKKGDLMGPFPLTDFANIPFSPSKTNFFHRRSDYHAPGTLRFQLRNLVTNKVSPLSMQEIYIRPHERWWQYQLFVRTRRK
jgi:hypothetical protein